MSQVGGRLGDLVYVCDGVGGGEWGHNEDVGVSAAAVQTK